uniref:Plakophilin 2 n=1 Tax=Pundamilia nyererei TaxID=303518 RepID=A0A3B4FTX5_9CICH
SAFPLTSSSFLSLSALPAPDSSVLDDTSLALPADLRSSTQPDEDRNQRVHRQVQLTMSRKSKKTQSNGNVHFENESASYFDAFGRNRVCFSFSFSQVNRSSFSSHSFSGDHDRKPSRRLEVSPQSSPEQPHRHFKCSTYSGMPTPSVSSHSPKVGTHLAKSASFHHHVFSDLPHSTQRCAYTPARGNVQQRTFRQTLGLQSVPICHLNGIEKLMLLLNNDSEEVQRATAGALRNAVYENDRNKLNVKEKAGLYLIATVLNSSRDKETRRHLTGLLWNLSSHDMLKEAFSDRALSTLSRSVLVPSSGIFEGENPKDELLVDDETFINATSCLRNLSSAGRYVREEMRNCENLIDSLIYYIRGTVANRKMDDKSTENCVCILHNLSYQIESELPKKNDQVLTVSESRQDLDSQPKTLGCFSYRSYAVHQHPLLEPEPNPNPHGIEWLWDTITVRMYILLMACSTNDTIKEAAIGALQNITAGKHEINRGIAVVIVQRENGLEKIKEILNGVSSNLKIPAVSLIKNISRYDQLRPAIANQVLPEMVKMLPFDSTDVNQTSEVTISLCEILTYLCLSDANNADAIIENRGIPKIINISKTDKGLVTLLNHSDTRHEKLGFKKNDFVNARTKRALSS